MKSSTALPDEHLARQLVIQAFGIQPIKVRRFPTGLMHFVFEVELDSQPTVVIRIAASYGHAAMRGAARLSRLLRPLKVPLPAILAENLAPPFPYLILERLAGSDLGEVIANLSQDSLEAVAGAVVEAQASRRRTAKSCPKIWVCGFLGRGPLFEMVSGAHLPS